MHRTARYAGAVGFSLVLHAWMLSLALPTPSKHLAPAVVYVTASLNPDAPAANKSSVQQSSLPKPQAPSQKGTPDDARESSPDKSTTSSVATDVHQTELSAASEVHKQAHTIDSPKVTAAPPAPPPDGYYPFEEVDQPATPQGDWLIDANVLPRGAMVRIELWLWISANGKIDRWELGPDTPIDGDLERALVELDQTPVRPALRNNITVPSFRRLEVFISRE